MQISLMFALGQILLWSGFLGGALASVWRLENPESPWATIPWGMYLLSAAVGTAGVVLLRIHKAKQRAESATSETELETLKETLMEIANKVEHLQNNLDDSSCEDVLEYIDEQCAEPLANFADGRMVISHRYGSQVYASVMTEFASGERYLNRAWSAAADGYVDEVAASIGYANTFFQAARDELSQVAPA